MHKWSDTGLIIDLQKFSEKDAIVTFLTLSHGKHKGVCKAAFSKKNIGSFQLGSLFEISWKARLEEHLGTAKAELLKSYCVDILEDSNALTVLSALCAMSCLLPERENVSDFFKSTLEQMILLPHKGVFERYAHWEVLLLKELGFGLDLSSCAVSGETKDLIYVSPNSGRAVSKKVAEPYKHKLLSLPEFLICKEKQPLNNAEIKKALHLTGFFLENYVIKTLNCSIPAVRSQILKKLSTD